MICCAPRVEGSSVEFRLGWEVGSCQHGIMAWDQGARREKVIMVAPRTDEDLDHVQDACRNRGGTFFFSFV